MYSNYVHIHLFDLLVDRLIASDFDPTTTDP